MAPTIKMGGGPNPPVTLDPAQIITGVHWPRLPTHIAFGLILSTNGGANDDQTCDGSGSPFPTGGGPHWSTYRTTLEYVYSFGSPVASISLFVNEAWEPTNLTASGVTVSDLPALPGVFNFGAWETVAGDGAFGDGVNSWQVRGGKGQWSALSGATLAIPVPGFADEFFIGATSADFAYWSDQFTGSPFCIESFTNRKWAACTGTTDVAGYTNATSHSSGSISIAGMSAQYPGTVPKNYSPKGMALVNGNAFKGGVDFVATLWLLFERDGL